jgi:hypothetical protein
MRDIGSDMAGACTVAVTEAPEGGGGALEVSSCLYADVLAAEGAPHLCRFLCCQHNVSFLKAYEPYGVRAELTECAAMAAAEGAPPGGRCRIVVGPAEPPPQ